MAKFNIGDKVIWAYPNSMKECKGFVGTVLQNDTMPYVEWETSHHYFHDADGTGRDEYCYAPLENEIELYSGQTNYEVY